MISVGEPSSLIKAAYGGRVAHTDFLDPREGDTLGAKLRKAKINYTRSGGYPGAVRTVLTAFPSNIPEASTKLTAVFFESVKDAVTLTALFKKWRINLGSVGDIIPGTKGMFAVTLHSNLPEMTVGGLENNELGKGTEVPLHVLGEESSYLYTVIVPSLRVDALGAKAFKVSRAFFKKGIDASNVTVNGSATKKSGLLVQGDEVFAEGLGRFTINEVLGETRKGNIRVSLAVEIATT